MNTGHGTYPDLTSGNPLLDDERWALALRIASSRHLLKAVQLRDILLYLCQQVISDPATVIREHEIGCNVLGRRADFNPNDDNIVRVQISHLRKKLDEYFATDGAGERLIVSIPKGSYMPRFAPRVPNQPGQAEPAVTSTVMVNPVAAPVLPVPATTTRWWLLRLIGVLVLLGMVAAITIYRKQPAASIDRSSDNFIWSSIFKQGAPPAIVVADSCLGLLQDTLGTDIALSEYIGGHYPEELLGKTPNEPLRSALATLASRQYTSLGDVEIASGLIQLGQRLGSNAAIHYARHMNVRNFQDGNFVLIGSRRSNPWVGLFEPQLNFVLDGNPQQHVFYIHNKRPRASELTNYAPVTKSGNSVESYATIALVPNLENTGSVLILNGITMETAEAAGRLILCKEFPATLSKILGKSRSPRSVEILLRVRAIGGAPSSAEVLASRAD